MYASVEVDADSDDPISYWTQLLFLCSPFANDAAPNENHLPSLSVTDFHVPFEDHVDFIFNDLLFEHQLSADQEFEADDHQINAQIEVSNGIDEMDRENYPDHEYQKQQQLPRKSPWKRDRHTKIKTAHGLRDRRMRLSLEVARRFFRLQDMLRFDKASKTIDWLLNQAKDEIERLERENNVLTSSSAAAKSVSSTSECEGLSGLDEVTGTGAHNRQQDEFKSSVLKERRTKRSPKIFLKPRPKEVRAKARERARERTKEKIMKSKKFVPEVSKYSAEETNHKPQIFGDQSHTSCQINISCSLDVMAKGEERSFHAKEHPGASYDEQLATVSKQNLPFLSNFLHNSETIQEHQFADLQYLHKPWEVYNILNQ